MSLKVLILGINGFIGHRLTEIILSKTDWEIYGMDLSNHRLEQCLRYPRFKFQQGDIIKELDWIKKHIEICDVVLPLAAIAIPSLYIKIPIKIFELDFEANLKIIKLVHEAQKRLIFPSSSEVYGMCDEPEFDEETSKLTLGPIAKERWIYSASKQLLDRIIYAYGKHEGLNFTLFRPFNWIGPKQDEVFSVNSEHSRVVSLFISNIIHGKNMVLVNGGLQKRCFTYIDDGIDAIIKMIKNHNNIASGRIFNIGNPQNNISIKELAQKIKTMALSYPKYQEQANNVQIISVPEESFYGPSYQDVANRLPSINNAKQFLDWMPRTDIDIALKNTLDYYLMS
jgi:nucleoside-diphosphate-sugar epimerase